MSDETSPLDASDERIAGRLRECPQRRCCVACDERPTYGGKLIAGWSSTEGPPPGTEIGGCGPTGVTATTHIFEPAHQGSSIFDMNEFLCLDSVSTSAVSGTFTSGTVSSAPTKRRADAAAAICRRVCTPVTYSVRRCVGTLHLKASRQDPAGVTYQSEGGRGQRREAFLRALRVRSHDDHRLPHSTHPRPARRPHR